MKAVSDVKLNYLVHRLNQAMDALEAAMKAHTDNQANPHAVTMAQVTGTPDGSLLEKMYPVGSVYLSVSEVDPATVFGGTWKRLEDVFLLASGKREAGRTGGEESHLLTTEEMPTHSHTFHTGGQLTPDPTTGTLHTAILSEVIGKTAQDSVDSSLNAAAGGAQEHNNMPPYLVVNMWKRIY